MDLEQKVNMVTDMPIIIVMATNTNMAIITTTVMGMSTKLKIKSL